jgi:hypothetical protein
VETSSYRDSFTFHKAREAHDDGRSLSKLYATKTPSHSISIFGENMEYLTVTWFEPRRYRTGTERVYCCVAYGQSGKCGQRVIDYCGGSGLCKFNGSFYGCLYNMGLDLYKDGTQTTAHYYPLDVIPALIRHLFNTQDLSGWTIAKYGI